MAAIGSRAPDVVDRARGVRDEVGEVGDGQRAAPSRAPARSRRAVRRPELHRARGRQDGERADRDHHRVPRPHLHERLRFPARVDPGPPAPARPCERVALRAEEELGQRQRPRPRGCSPISTTASSDQQRRVRVARGGGGAEIPADRAAVADLRRADRARGLGERGQELGELRLHRLGVRQARAEAE